jgi:putative resolvase
MPVPARRLEPATIWVDVAPADTAGCVACARVCWHDQRADRGRRVGRLAGRTTSDGHEIGVAGREAGSGLNGKRPRLRGILPGPSATVVAAERGDRLAGFGV